MTELAVPKIWIPEVPREEILKRARRIRPVIELTGSGAGLFYLRRDNLFNISFLLPSKRVERAKGLKKVCDITTYHESQWDRTFMPSVAEVLAQIPAEYLERVVAFRIVASPEDANDLDAQQEALDAGYDVAITRLYVPKESEPKTGDE